MKYAPIIIILIVLALAGCGLASCASQLLDGGTRAAARTSCVGLINIGSCNVTQTQGKGGNDSTLLIVLGAFGVGCLLIGFALPSKGGGA